MQTTAENPEFLAACFLVSKNVPYPTAMGLPSTGLREFVRAFDQLGQLKDAEKKALAPFLDD